VTDVLVLGFAEALDVVMDGAPRIGTISLLVGVELRHHPHGLSSAPNNATANYSATPKPGGRQETLAAQTFPILPASLSIRPAGLRPCRSRTLTPTCDALALRLHRRRADVLHVLVDEPRFTRTGRGRFTRWRRVEARGTDRNALEAARATPGPPEPAEARRAA
jgi:hypothetical protein